MIKTLRIPDSKFTNQGYTKVAGSIPTSMMELYDRDIGDGKSRRVIEIKAFEKMGRFLISDLVGSSTFLGNDPIKDAIVEQTETSLQKHQNLYQLY